MTLLWREKVSNLWWSPSTATRIHSLVAKGEKHIDNRGCDEGSLKEDWKSGEGDRWKVGRDERALEKVTKHRINPNLWQVVCSWRSNFMNFIWLKVLICLIIWMSLIGYWWNWMLALQRLRMPLCKDWGWWQNNNFVGLFTSICPSYTGERENFKWECRCCIRRWLRERSIHWKTKRIQAKGTFVVKAGW